MFLSLPPILSLSLSPCIISNFLKITLINGDEACLEFFTELYRSWEIAHFKCTNHK